MLRHPVRSWGPYRACLCPPWRTPVWAACAAALRRALRHHPRTRSAVLSLEGRPARSARQPPQAAAAASPAAVRSAWAPVPPGAHRRWAPCIRARAPLAALLSAALCALERAQRMSTVLRAVPAEAVSGRAGARARAPAGPARRRRPPDGARRGVWPGRPAVPRAGRAGRGAHDGLPRAPEPERGHRRAGRVLGRGRARAAVRAAARAAASSGHEPGPLHRGCSSLADLEVRTGTGTGTGTRRRLQRTQCARAGGQHGRRRSGASASQA